MRDSVPEAYSICCLWIHIEKELKSKLSPGLLKRATEMFLAGAYDKDFIDRLKIQGSISAAVAGMKWLQLLQGTETQVLSVDEVHENAQRGLEKAKLAAFEAQLLKEQQQWSGHVAAVRDFENMHKASKRESLLENKARFEAACRDFQKEVLPVVTVDDHCYLMSQVLETSGGFYQSCGAPHGYHVVVVDFTKLGTSWSKHVNQLTGDLSALLHASPQHSCGLVIAPNRAMHGQSDSDAKVCEGVQDVETALRGSLADLEIRRITLAFDEESLQSSTRSAVHDGWIVCSSKETDAHFFKSELWVRRLASSLKVRATAEHVVPGTQITGAASAVNASKSQRMKQMISGSLLWQQILTKLWANLKAELPVFYTDLLAYDLSLGEAVLHRKKTHPNQFSAVLSVVHHVEHEAERASLGNYLKQLSLRKLAKMSENGTIKIPNYNKVEMEVTSCPTFDEKDYKVCMPLKREDGFALVLRQAYLDQQEWIRSFGQMFV